MLKEERRGIIMRLLKKYSFEFTEEVVDFLSTCAVLEDELTIEGRVVWIDLQAEGRGVDLELARAEMEKFTKGEKKRKELEGRPKEAPERSPLFSAISDGDRGRVRKILSSSSVDIEDVSDRDDGMTPLLLACWMRDAAMTEMMIKAGADVNNDGQHAYSPVHYAARSMKLLTMLLDAGADPNRLGEDECTALQIVSDNDRHLEQVRLLLDRGADAGHCNKLGETALGIARKAGAEKITRLLEQASA